MTKGFTLIELLVVIAIVAVLAVVVILTLNPAELLKQARDSNRMADLNAVQGAIALYITDGQSTIAPDYTTCWMTVTATAQCGATFSTAYTGSSTTSTVVTGTGWVPINFDLISTKSPIARLPLDPVNSGAFFYAYGATTTNSGYKLVANMESARFAENGTSDVESRDGGTESTHYEVGSALNL